MTLGLFKPRVIWCLTRLGWICVLGIGFAAILLFGFEVESFLSVTRKVPAEILMVVGTLNREGLSAAGAEFVQGGYQYVVITGGKLPDDWELLARSNFAGMAETELIKAGVPNDRIVIAPAIENQSRRESAGAVKRTFDAKGIHPTGANLFTLGVSGRLNRGVFEQVLQPGIRVGVISWRPADYEAHRWWHSSERVRGLISECIDFIYETFLGSRNDPSTTVPTSLQNIDKVR
jgi:hypothetical protein